MRLEHGCFGVGKGRVHVTRFPVQHFLSSDWRAVGRNGIVLTGGVQTAGFDIVAKVRFQDMHRPQFAFSVQHRDQQLDSTIQVAGHPVGAGDVHEVIAAMVEVKNPGVFQHPVDDAGHANVLADSGQTGPQATDAANIQANLDPFHRRVIQRGDQFFIDQ